MRLSIIVMVLLLIAGCSDDQMLRVSKNEQDKKNLIWIEATAQINSPLDEVWKLVAEDFDKNSLYTYNIDKSFYRDKKSGMIGSVRSAVETSGDSFDVEIIDYNPANKFIEWEIIRAEVPIETGVASYTLKDMGDTTELTFKGGFKMKYFFMDWMAKQKFPDGFKAIMAGVKLRVEKDIKLTEENLETVINEYGDQLQAKIL